MNEFYSVPSFSDGCYALYCVFLWSYRVFFFQQLNIRISSAYYQFVTFIWFIFFLSKSCIGMFYVSLKNSVYLSLIIHLHILWFYKFICYKSVTWFFSVSNGIPTCLCSYALMKRICWSFNRIVISHFCYSCKSTIKYAALHNVFQSKQFTDSYVLKRNGQMH